MVAVQDANGNTVNGTFTFTARGTGSDGSTFQNHTTDHFNQRPDGTVGHRVLTVEDYARRLADDRPALAHHLSDGHGIPFADGVADEVLRAYHAGAHHPQAMPTHEHPQADLACDIVVEPVEVAP